MTLLKATYQAQVYLGELSASGILASPPRRLTHGEAIDVPSAWTADSKAVVFYSNRYGKSAIFKQMINQETPELVAGGPQETFNVPRIGPDGSLILYSEMPKSGNSSPRLMRIPVSGGVAQPVMELAKNADNYTCARAPATLCVVEEYSDDQKQLVISAFDPLKGRGKVLKTIQKDPLVYFNADISPDGNTIAVSKLGVPDIRIQLIPVSGGVEREIVVKGWSNMTGRDWAADGKGFYCGINSPQDLTLLYIDLEGNARVVWQSHGPATGEDFWAIPSPDGRYLAIRGDVVSRNAWIMEGF